jgi:hypothetical protein
MVKGLVNINELDSTYKELKTLDFEGRQYIPIAKQWVKEETDSCYRRELDLQLSLLIAHHEQIKLKLKSIQEIRQIMYN